MLIVFIIILTWWILTCGVNNDYDWLKLIAPGTHPYWVIPKGIQCFALFLWCDENTHGSLLFVDTSSGQRLFTPVGHIVRYTPMIWLSTSGSPPFVSKSWWVSLRMSAICTTQSFKAQPRARNVVMSTLPRAFIFYVCMYTWTVLSLGNATYCWFCCLATNCHTPYHFIHL